MEPIQSNGSVAILLLAAGSSTRMGSSKQLLPVNDKPLLLLSVDAALGAKADQVVVVLGAGNEEHRKIIQHLPLEIVYNPDWKKGMGNSLKKGLDHILALKSDTNAVIVMVCDQPLINSSHLNRLILRRTVTKCPLIASSYRETTGVPVLFDQSLFKTLQQIEDTAGAKQILKSHPHETINFDGGEIDLDTPEDYQSFIR